MESEQAHSTDNPDRAGLRAGPAEPKAARVGEGAASALASLRRLERDRMIAAPADERPPG